MKQKNSLWHQLREVVRICRVIVEVVRVQLVLKASYKVIPMKRGGLNLTVRKSRYHLTILEDEKSLSSHISRDIPGGEKEYGQRTAVDKSVITPVIERVQTEVELPDKERVFVWDTMAVIRMASIIVRMKPEESVKLMRNFADDREFAGQEYMIGMASGAAFGHPVLSRMKLKRARRKAHLACVLNYKGELRLATIKERTVLILDRMDRETIQMLGGIINYPELFRGILRDEEHILGVKKGALGAVRKEMLPKEPDEPRSQK